MKRSRLITLSVVTAATGFAWLAWTHRAVAPNTSWSGRDSKIVRLSYQRITSREAWVKLWEQHTGRKTASNDFFALKNAPRINFDTCMVVAVFQGKGWNNDGVEIESSVLSADVLRIRLKNRYFQTGGPDGGGQKVTPYGIFVLPRSDRTIILQEDVRIEMFDPPLWKERARLK